MVSGGASKRSSSSEMGARAPSNPHIQRGWKHRRSTVRILSIDGGGIRGVVPAVIMQRLAATAGLEDFLDRADLIAGITVAALVVPKSLGYAGIAGVPIEYGLYAAAAGAILYAIFGLSGQIATGPSSALAAVAAGAMIIPKPSASATALRPKLPACMSPPSRHLAVHALEHHHWSSDLVGTAGFPCVFFA